MMPSMKPALAAWAAVFAFASIALAAPPVDSPEAKKARLEWFQQAGARPATT
jgi:hypothetical protein